MHMLIPAAALLAAGAVGWALAKRQSAQEEEPHVLAASEAAPLPEDEAETADASAPEEQSALAEVLHCARRMDPLTLTGASDVTFILADGTELDFHITGDGSQHLQVGDSGLLTWAGAAFILFEKGNGEIIGGMFYSPAESEADADE